MAIPKDQLSLLIRDWYYAASEGKSDVFLKFFVQDENATYFGTDPQEIWHGYEQIRSNVLETFRKYGKWTVMSKNLKVHVFADVAVFTDEVELSAYFKDNSIAEDARVSGVLVRKNAEWKILQAHFSFGIPNDSLLPE